MKTYTVRVPEPVYGSVSTMMTAVLGFFVPACIILICAIVMFRIVQQQRAQIRAIECAVTEASRNQSLKSQVKGTLPRKSTWALNVSIF